MRREDHVGLLLLDGLDDFLDRDRRHGRAGLAVVLHAGLEHGLLGRDVAHGEDVTPAEAKEPVADHEAVLLGAELARDRLHGVGARAGDDSGGLGVVNFLEDLGDVAHLLLERRAHQVDGAVSVDHRVLEQVAFVLLDERARMLGVHGHALGRRLLRVRAAHRRERACGLLLPPPVCRQPRRLPLLSLLSPLDLLGLPRRARRPARRLHCAPREWPHLPHCRRRFGIRPRAWRLPACDGEAPCATSERI
mmetsp:Transcript_13102/g.41814  ORF Transcript_13102/g.41814 Transcript_13102/m.41814 type:complete len:249 (+) Transcript_13102:961-1707(+)